MKRVLTVMLVFVMLMTVAMTAVNAATSSTLADQLYAIGSKYGMPASQKVSMERYLADHPLTEAECNEILGLANQADKIMQENGTTDYKSLPADVKAKLKSLANQAASIAGVTLNFTADGIKVFDKDGKLLDNYSSNNGTSGGNKLAYTGNNTNIALVVSSIAVIALAATGVTVATKKRLTANG